MTNLSNFFDSLSPFKPLPLEVKLSLVYHKKNISSTKVSVIAWNFTVLPTGTCFPGLTDIVKFFISDR